MPAPQSLSTGTASPSYYSLLRPPSMGRPAASLSRGQELNFLTELPRPPKAGILRRSVNYFRELFNEPKGEAFPEKLKRIGTQAAIVTGASIASALIGNALSRFLGVQTGNASAAGPDFPVALKELVATVVVAAPLLEETVFRGIPLLLRKAREVVCGSHSKAFDAALLIGSTLVFALAHNITSDSSVVGIQIAEGLRFSLQHLPIPQAIVGMWLWHLAKNHGLRWSIAGHAAHNAMAIGLGLLLS